MCLSSMQCTPAESIYRIMTCWGVGWVDCWCCWSLGLVWGVWGGVLACACVNERERGRARDGEKGEREALIWLEKTVVLLKEGRANSLEVKRFLLSQPVCCEAVALMFYGITGILEGDWCCTEKEKKGTETQRVFRNHTLSLLLQFTLTPILCLVLVQLFLFHS